VSGEQTSESKTLGRELRRLRSSVEELQFLNRLAREIGSSLDTDQILETVVSGSLSALHAEQGVISLVGSAGDEQRTIARIKEGARIGAKLQLSPVVLGWMHIHKEALLLGDPRGDERFAQLRWDDRIDSLLSVPLISKSELTGVLTVFNKKGGGGFTEQDKRLLSIIAAQSVHVVTNARLVEQEREMHRVHARLQGELEQSYMDTVQKLARAVEYRDSDTGFHLLRISKYCELLAEGLKLPAEQARLIFYASPMHDVGKIGVPDHILLKQGDLTDEEWKIMQSHTVMGAEILGGSKGEILQLAAEIALNHHERWDGSGYPNGLAGPEIPIAARILAVADIWDAMRSNRSYKSPYTVEESRTFMEEARGTSLEPEIVDIFLDRLDAVLRIEEEVAKTVSETTSRRPT
jgi:response regulator RpfG family c-di-GMP phosphodiesterase